MKAFAIILMSLFLQWNLLAEAFSMHACEHQAGKSEIIQKVSAHPLSLTEILSDLDEETNDDYSNSDFFNETSFTGISDLLNKSTVRNKILGYCQSFKPDKKYILHSVFII